MTAEESHPGLGPADPHHLPRSSSLVSGGLLGALVQPKPPHTEGPTGRLRDPGVSPQISGRPEGAGSRHLGQSGARVERTSRECSPGKGGSCVHQGLSAGEMLKSSHTSLWLLLTSAVESGVFPRAHS